MYARSRLIGPEAIAACLASLGGPLNLFALALSAALEVLEVGALAFVVRDGVGFSAVGVGEL